MTSRCHVSDGSTRRVTCDSVGVAEAARVVGDGGVIIFPTDTVYGIGCNPYDARAVRRIYDIKSRDRAKPLPLLAGSIRSVKQIAIMNETAGSIADRFWPGPLTIILRPRDARLVEALGLRDADGIAVRIPNHMCTLEILKHCNVLAGTSANLSGHPPTGDPEECVQKMYGYDLLVDGGVMDDPVPSTIVDARGGNVTIIREGPIILS